MAFDFNKFIGLSFQRFSRIVVRGTATVGAQIGRSVIQPLPSYFSKLCMPGRGSSLRLRTAIS